MYAAFYFVELYFTIVKQFGSDKAGVNLLYYLPGLGGMSEVNTCSNALSTADAPQLAYTSPCSYATSGPAEPGIRYHLEQSLKLSASRSLGLPYIGVTFL